MNFLSRAALASIGLSVGLSGCVGAIDDPEPFFAEVAAGDCTPADVPRLLERRCATEGCHDETDRASGLVLEVPGLEEAIVGQSSDEGGECAGQLYVDPTSPEQSLLIDKVSSSPRCGGRMPLAGSFLSRSERRCLEAWVAEIAARGAASPMDAGADE